MHKPTGGGGEVVRGIISCRRNKLGRNYEESSTWGNRTVSMCKVEEMHRWSGDGGWHSGADREQTVCANINRARVLHLLLPQCCQIEYFPWLRNEILMGLKPMAQLTLTYLVQSLCLRYVFRLSCSDGEFF